MLICGPNRECTLLCTLRREYTLSQGLNRKYTLPELSISGWLSGCLPGRYLRGFLLPLSYFRTPRHGTLYLGTLQKLIHQGSLLCKGACQLYDLSRQVLFTICVGRTWTEYFSVSSESVVYYLGNVKSVKK